VEEPFDQADRHAVDRRLDRDRRPWVRHRPRR